MTAESVRQVAVERLQEKIRAGKEKIHQARYRPPSIDRGVMLPGCSAEEIGMVVSEVNAEIRALESAVEIINDAYRTITNPTTPEAEESKQSESTERMY